MIAIRANASPTSGIGHLARCYRLAAALKKYKFNSHFFVDQENPFLRDYLQPFDCSHIYDSGEGFIDEKTDAEHFMAALQGMQVDAVVVDDYRLSETWERACRHDISLIVLDDRDSASHHCSIIVDGKWAGPSTSERYRNRVPERCVRLLGPQYLLLASPLAERSGVSSGEPAAGRTINIMVSLGGGGSLTVAARLIQQMLLHAPHDLEFLIRPVIGYFAINKEMILSLAEQDSRVKPIIHEKSLHGYMENTTLYIGAAGGTLYEVLSMNIPAITFALSDNQQNQLSDLGDLGHYFHLNDIGHASFVKLAELAWLMVSKIDRIRHLYSQTRTVEIDGLGLTRVAKAIDSMIKGESLVAPSPLVDWRRVDTDAVQDYIFELVDDRHINRCLDARNLDQNLQNMTETQKVHRLDHYIWWLKSERVSYLLKKGGKPLLYIWHQPRIFDVVTVLVGGWFVCSETCGAVDVLYALNRQLKITSAEFPGVPWIVVIKKTNRYVLSLNKRFGFEPIDRDNRLYEIAKQCFPHSTPEGFSYFCRL